MPQVQISAAGRVLTEVLQTGAAVARPAAAPASIQDPVPLLPAPPNEAAPLVAALKGALDRSGLFYESHLVQWFAGDRPLAALLREPQGRLSTAAQVPQPSPEDSDSSAGARVGCGSQSKRPAPAGRSSRAAAPSRWIRRCSARSAASWRCIEQRQVVWQGQAWPGQALEWRIEEPPERGASHGRPDALDHTPAAHAAAPGRGERGAGPERGNVRVRLAAQAGASRRGAARRSQRRSPRRCRTRDWCWPDLR